MGRDLPVLLATLLLTAPVTSNAQALDQYLRPTVDAQADPADPTGNTFHPELVAKANELETPLRMFEFVHDQIEYEVYYGSKKGALGTLWSGRGNDLDQASLLIALLRAKNIRARYATGWVNVPMEQAKSWAGTLDTANTKNLFGVSYCWNPAQNPPALDCGPGQFSVSSDVQIRLKHAWVEVEASAAYRGRAVGASDLLWIPLDPSWKQKDYQPGIAGIPLGDAVTSGTCPAGTICFDYDAYYSKRDPRLATEIWESQILEWLEQSPYTGAAVTDIPYDGPIRSLALEVLPLSLPFEPLTSPTVVTAYAEVPSNLRHRLKISVEQGTTGLLTKTFEMPNVVHRRMTLSFEPRNTATRQAMLEAGGYLGEINGADSLAQFCVSNPGNSKCETVPVIKVDGVNCTNCLDPENPTNQKVVLSSGVLVVADRDFVPGKLASELVGGPAPAVYNVAAGSFASIGLDAVHTGPAQVDDHIEKLLALGERPDLYDEGEGDANGNQIPGEVLLDQGSSGITTGCNYADVNAIDICDIAVAAHYKKNDDFIGELLHLGTLRYFQRVREEERRLFRIDRLVGVQFPAVGMTLGGLSVEYLFDRPVSVEPAAPVMDIRSIVNGTLPVGGGPSDGPEGRLFAHVVSALEHQVWEELTGREFVSTVKGFQIVRERFPTEPIRRYDASNVGLIASQIVAFPFDSMAAAAIFDDRIGAVSGLTIVTPVASALGDAGGADVYIEEIEESGSTTYLMLIEVRGVVAGGAFELFVDPLTLYDQLVSRADSNLVGPSYVTADPVSIVSGNNYVEERDLLIPTHGPPFEFVRAYNSQSDRAGELGFGWSHSYEVRVEPPRDEQEFVYLPTSLTLFADVGAVEGARSDSIETWSTGTGSGSVETAQWPALPAGFTQRASIERVELEVAYHGAFTLELWNGATKILGPTIVPTATGAGEIKTEQYELSPLVAAGPFELRLTSNFDSADSLYYARLRIHFRGPRLERVALPNLPSVNVNWPSTAKLADGDPWTCETPTVATPAPLDYPAPPDVEGAIAIEVSASVQATSGSSRASLWLGPSATGPRFRLGPNGLVTGQPTAKPGWARLRFQTLNTLFTNQVSYQTTTTPIVKLCHLERTLLRMRDELELVLATGVRERFTRAGSTWKAGPGVRDKLTDRPGGGYVVTRVDGSTLELAEPRANGEWRLSRIADAQERGLTLTYNAGTQRLESVAEEGAESTRRLLFAYDGAYLDRITDWDGREWDYDVDAQGDLREFKDTITAGTGVGVVYDYESGHAENPALNHNLERLTYPQDQNGGLPGGFRSVEFTYYNDDKVASHTDSLGNTQTFLFNVPRLENQTTDPRGFTTVYRHDVNGNLVQRRDPDGATWAWEYDEDRNVISETDPFGAVRLFSSFNDKGSPGQIDDRDGKSHTITYDSLTGAPEIVVDKRGNTRTVTLTSDGLPEATYATMNGQAPLGTLLSTNFYDPASRRVTQRTEPLGDGTGRLRDTRFYYEEPEDPTDRDLSRVESRDENGNVIAQVEYDYDAVGHLRFERVQREASASDPTLIELETEIVTNQRDQVERIIRPDGTSQVFEYDKNGNLERRYIEERRPDGQWLVHDLVQLHYDAMDRVREQVDAADGTTTYGYDASGNRISMTDPEGHTWRTEYDAMNRLVRVEDPNGAVTTTEYDAAGRPIAMTDATGIVTRRSYDAIGRLVEYQYAWPDRPAATRVVEYGQTGPTAYQETITDPEGRSTKYELDDLGRVFKVTDAATPSGITQIAHTLLGSPQTVTDPIGKQTLFGFDTLGRTVTVDPYYAGLEQLVYDQTGNVIWRQKPDLCQLEQDYDEMGRLVARRTINSAGSCANSPIDEQFGYDARGLLVAAQNPNVGLIREYDALGRMLREIDSRFGSEVGYAYDQTSRLTSKVYPDGSTVHYAYDGAGRTVGISDPFGDTTRFVYDAAGRRIQKLGTQGLRTEYGYDPETGWLTSVSSYTAASGIAATFTYPTHDDVGNRLSMTETSGGPTSYGYDALDRLSTLDPPNEAIYPANGAPTEFAYDAAGNRTDFGPKSGGSFVAPHTTYTYNATTKRLLNIKLDNVIVETLGLYDVNGNPGTWTPQPEGSPQRTLKYDAFDRLVSITGGFTASYVYDPFGRRIEKTEAGTTTRYQYDGLDVVAEYSTTSLQATYVFGPGIDEVLKLKRGTTVAAYHSDGLGSVVAISENATLRNVYRYDAFGKPVAQGGSSPLTNAYTYTGRELDASGLYYYRARYYLPSAGRFLTPDPIGLRGGLNAYTYVGSNPVNYTDPFGLRAGSALAPAAPVLGGLQPGDITPIMQVGEFLRGDDVRSMISEYGSEIEGAAADYGVDANIMRAIIYEEQTHLIPLVESGVAEWLGIGNTAGLGQVTVGYYDYSRSELLDPATNIRAMGIHLSTMGYFPPIDPAAPISSAGTRYNGMSYTSISPYGRRVDFYYAQFSRGIWP